MSRPLSNKPLLVIICVLLLTNIALLAWFFWPRPQNDAPRNGATEMLKNDVGFSDAQLAQYKVLRDKQKENIRPVFEQMRGTKDSLFRLLGDTSVSDSALNAITDHIAQQQKMLDLSAFHHFSEVRKICTPDQRVAYDSMVVRMFHRMGRPQGKKADEKNDNKK